MTTHSFDLGDIVKVKKKYRYGSDSYKAVVLDKDSLDIRVVYTNGESRGYVDWCDANDFDLIVKAH